MNTLKRILQNWLERRLNNTVLPEDVFTYSPKLGKIYLGGQEIPENEARALQEEIKFLEMSKIWKIWNTTVTKQAIDTSMYNSTTFDDMRTGKCFLKVLATFQDINTVIKSWKPRKENLPNQH